ncbi:MAG: hypothetical protein RR500_00775 [Bacilli bacterium]
MKKRINWKKAIENEDGDVLLFAIIILLFLIFMTSVISGAVISRANIAREITDSNKLVSQLEHGNSIIEGAIQEIVYQNDELARYYISQNYYTKTDTSFGSGKTDTNATLDTYLKGLVSLDFQKEIKAKGGRNLEEIASVMFMYLTLVRGDSDRSIILNYNTVNIGIKKYLEDSIKSVPDLNYKVSIDEIKPSIADRTYREIVSYARNAEIMKISYTGDLSTTTDKIARQGTNVVGSINSLEYRIGADGKTIEKPETQLLKGAYRISKYQSILQKK